MNSSSDNLVETYRGVLSADAELEKIGINYDVHHNQQTARASV
ncbi:hypothetical protein [Parasedimentitalea maritima]|nr:hypothetical protein [Zongyanglinia marina]